MRKLLSTTFVSLDGIMQSPGAPEEDPSHGFDRGGWMPGYWSDELGVFMNRTMTPPFELVLGRRTFDVMAAFWPTAPAAEEPHLMNDPVKHVASRGTVDTSKWYNARQLDGDIVQAITALKEQDGPVLQVHGSSNLLQTLFAANLVDEVRMLIHPVVVGGGGKRLFGDGVAPTGLKLVDHTVSPTGVIMVIYERTGAIPTGTFLA